jgi:hypothetical protein
MKLIAHRALQNGPCSDLENHPSEIARCLSQGLDVEIDVWYRNSQWWLGHDAPSYVTTLEFLQQSGLWIHVKNFEAADQALALTHRGWNWNFFSHSSDNRTLTSHGFWWTQPGQELGARSVAVMPEWTVNLNTISSVLNWNCAAVCSDYVGELIKHQKRELC